MAEVKNTLVIRPDQERQWGTTLFAIMDYTTPVPPALVAPNLFGVDRTPIDPPVGALDLGLITTDGVVNADELSSQASNALQQLEPTRNDPTGREKSLTVAFTESNAWVNALYHLRPVSEFPADKFGAWDFSDDDDHPFSPWYRILLLAQDGVGQQAFHRVEVGYRAMITAKTERAMARSSETYGFTFALFKDPVLGRSYRRAQDSPTYAAPLEG